MSFQLEKCLKKSAQLRQDQAPLMSGRSLDRAWAWAEQLWDNDPSLTTFNPQAASAPVIPRLPFSAQNSQNQTLTAKCVQVT